MMRKIISMVVVVFFMACHNAENLEHGHEHTGGGVKNAPDSLMALIMEGHDAAMPKMSKIAAAQRRVQQALDSISKLPEKLRHATMPYQQRLDSLLKDLQSAETEMNRWMENFVMDSAENNMELRLNYLESEKQKIATVKENIFYYIQKVDSVFKK